jgi:A/G-specific adenine glycosylase
MDIEFYWENILNWFSDNRRSFPWRNTENPYFILIAEYLLQQTNARKVPTVYLKIITEYSTIELLSNADKVYLEKIIKPLGFLFRAERMIESAKIVTSEYDGRVPSEKSELKKLPGVGNYISDAVMCYAFNKRTIPIDTNVIRLFSRFFKLESKVKRKRDDQELRNKIIYLFKSSDYSFGNYKPLNLAILDYASLVCSSRNPDCKNCLLSIKCAYFKDEV